MVAGIQDKFRKIFKESKYKDWIIGGIIILIALVGYIVYKNVSKPRTNPEAERIFMQSFLLYLYRNDTLTSVEGWKEVSLRYPNTIWGKRALYFLGFYYMSRGDYEKAKGYFKDFLKSGLKDRFLKAGAFINLASCEANLGAYRKASDYALKAAEILDYKSFRGYFYYKAAIYSKMAMDYKKALDILEKFDYKGHFLQKEASRLKTELKLLINKGG